MSQVDRAAVANINREVSIQLLKVSKAYAVRTPKGQKDPGHFKWDPKNNSFEESQKAIYNLERSEDNIGIHLFGKVVDVDVDTANPMMIAALDHFLPHTAHVWGRSSRPRSHRLYEISGYDSDSYDPGNYRFLQVITRYDDIKLEIRGGEMKSGRYSLLPGSIHPSGEVYEWADLKVARSSPVTVDLNKLLRAVRFSCIAAAIAPYWTEGQRNTMCMALSGFMHRAAAHMADLGDKASFTFEKDDAKGLLKGICELAGDDEQDMPARFKTFEQTWEKAEQGHKVKGATSLAELTGNEDIVQLLYTLLIDSPGLRELDEFMDRYAVRNNTSNVIDRERAGHRGAVSIMTMNDFHNSNMHRTVDINGSKVPMSRLLVASTRALRVEGLAFVPGEGEIVERGPEKYINQWRGFAIEPWQQKVENEEVEPFLRYLDRVIAQGNPAIFTWVLGWLADIFKYPAEKIGTAMVLVGLPGSGKSFLGANILRPIIGRNHSMQVNSIDAITGQFNSDSANMLLIQCDEALNSQRRADANRLKSMITDPTRRIEPKGVNAYEVEEHARYLFTSNERDNALSITDGNADRRYSVFDTSDDYSKGGENISEAKKREFWKEMYAWTSDLDNMSKLHRYFLDHQYDRDFIRTPMDTEARRRLQQYSQRGFDDWLMELASMEHPFDSLRERDYKANEAYINKAGRFVSSLEDWPDLVVYSRMKQSYGLYRNRKGGGAALPTYNEQQIKKEFISRGLLPKTPLEARPLVEYEVFENGSYTTDRRRLRATQFPKKEQIIDYLSRRYGYRIVDFEEVTTESGIKENGPKF